MQSKNKTDPLFQPKLANIKVSVCYPTNGKVKLGHWKSIEKNMKTKNHQANLHSRSEFSNQRIHVIDQ